MDLAGIGGEFGVTIGAKSRTKGFNTAAGAKVEHDSDLLGP